LPFECNLQRYIAELMDRYAEEMSDEEVDGIDGRGGRFAVGLCTLNQVDP
jgi:hypothetical protein